MNKIMRTLLLSPIFFAVSSCGAGTSSSSSSSSPQEETSQVPDLGPVDVVIISGQSNGVGCSYVDCLFDSMGSDKYAEYSAGYPEIQIAYDCWTKEWAPSGEVTGFVSQNSSPRYNFTDVKLGQGNGSRTFGPEIGIAEATHEKYNGKLFLIKYACGGSNLKDDWARRKSPMYGRFIDYVKLQMGNLAKKGYSPTIKAFCWMQGEGDSYKGYYDQYKDNLRGFLKNVRDDLRDLAGNKDIPFIDAGISDAEIWEYSAQVNQAKKEFAEESENNYFIDTIAAGLHTDHEPAGNIDTAHYDSDSEIQLGHLFAEAFEKFLS